MKQKRYSSALNDIIEAGHADAANLTTTSYNGLTHSLIAQHLLGQKQYELTNHLGNVQATLSDKRYVKTLSGTGATATRDYFNASIVAAYDYYPYGMLMPGRWTSDTDAHCSSLSLSQLVPHKTNTDIAGGTALSPGFSLIHGATAVTPTTGLGTTSGYTVYGRGGGISKTLTVTSGVPIAINISIPYIYGSFITISVRETKAGVTSVLASKNVSAASSYVLNVTPTTGSISIVAEAMSSFAAAPSSGLFTLGYLGYEQVTYVPENVLVNLCSDNKDKYEFGYNGQMKVNEIAGIGNWNTAEFWEYNTRTGIRANRDPKYYISPGLSPYSTFAGNPIWNMDPNGDKEYNSYEKYKKALGDKAIAQKDWHGQDGNWLKSDREDNKDRWDRANNFNLQRSDGYKEYNSIEQRAGFYGWYTVKEDMRGGETKWAGAAYMVAKQITLMDVFFRSGDLQMMYGKKDAADLNGFANAGNKAIFEDVFDNLRDNMNGAPKKGLAARRWDEATLHHEQFDVVQPIYKAWTQYNPKLKNYLQNFASGTGISWFMHMPMKFKGNIMNPQDRYNHGMNVVVPFYEAQKKAQGH